MVKLSESRGKSGESFARLFGNESLGRLLSKVQAATIRSGFELEEILQAIIPDDQITSLEELASYDFDPKVKPPIQLVFKPSRQDPDLPQKSIQADLLIVDHQLRQFLLVEVKEGYVFDTKKSDGELSSLKRITNWLASEFPYRANYALCSFNQDSKELIVLGSKRRFSIDHVMTGRELCDRIGVDYEALTVHRKINQIENLDYFVSELLSIAEIRTMAIEIIRNSEVK